MNFGPAAHDYAKHRQTFPESYFDRFPLQGTLLDLGSGTGSLARGYAVRGAQVIAADLSPAMLRQAADLPRRVVARAEASPFRSASFDAVTAGQCWHWFDGPAVARECRRLLRPGGRIVIAHFNYLPLPGSAAEASEALILAENPDWPLAGISHMAGVWDAHLVDAGFEDLTSSAYELDVPYSHEAWRGRMRACNGVLALGPDRIATYDDALAVKLRESFPEPLSVRHEVFALMARVPGNNPFGPGLE
jgi:SAM-dependent methyltransferase